MSKCEGCDGCLMAGVRDHSDSGRGADIPYGWHCIERCDACERYASHVEAAIAWNEFHKLHDVRLLSVPGGSYDVAVPETKEAMAKLEYEMACRQGAR